MADKKQTLYEILQVAPNASIAEIKIAHRLLTRQLVSEKLGLQREEINLKLQILDVALSTLSVQADRDAYDAQLSATPRPGSAPLSDGTNLVPQRAGAALPNVVAALESSYRAGARSDLTPLAIMSTTVNTSVSILGKMLRIVVGLMVLGIVIAVTTSMMAGRRASPTAKAMSKAEEKVLIQEYYQQHGVRVGSKEEIDLLEIENRRKVNEARAAELEQKKRDDDYRRFVEESRREANRVSADLQRSEQQARYEAAQEERQKQAAEERERRQAEWERGAETRRVQEARRKAGLN